MPVAWDKLLRTDIGDEAFRTIVRKHGLKSVKIAQTNWRGETATALPEEFWQEVLEECRRQVSEILAADRDLTRAERNFIRELNESGFLRRKGRPPRRYNPLDGAERWIKHRMEELNRAGVKPGKAREKAAEELSAIWQSVGHDCTAEQMLNYMRRSKTSRTK